MPWGLIFGTPHILPKWINDATGGDKRQIKSMGADQHHQATVNIIFFFKEGSGKAANESDGARCLYRKGEQYK
jgi:hypothetical protein